MPEKKNWLITPPENKTLKQASIEACRGNEKHAELLNYFIFSAQCEAENQKLDIKTVESVTLGKRDQDSILRSLEKHKNVKTTKKTLIEWIKKLEDYGFIKADGRRHTYHVYINPIRDAIKEPPAREPGKPRGKNVNSPSKTLIQAQINVFSNDTTINLFEERINALQLTINELGQRLQLTINEFDEKVNSLIVDRDAWRAAAEGKIEALYIKLSNTETNTHTTKEGNAAKADTVPSLQLEQEEIKTSSSGRKPAKSSSSKIVSLQEHKEKAAPPAFSEREQQLYDAWAGGKWFRGYPPKITDTLRQHIAKAVSEWVNIPTTEEIEACRKWYKAKWPGRSFEMGNLVNGEFANWLNATSDKAPAPATTSKQSTQGSLFEQPAESSAPEPEQKDAGPDLVYWTLDGDHKSRNYLTWGWMPFEEAQKLGMKFRQLQPVPIQRDTFQSKKATACKNLGLLDEFLKLSKEEQWKPLTEWVKQFQTTTVTA